MKNIVELLFGVTLTTIYWWFPVIPDELGITYFIIILPILFIVILVSTIWGSSLIIRALFKIFNFSNKKLF